jgi:hypothetical protein
MRKYLSLVIVVFAALVGCKKKSGPAAANSVQIDNRLDTLVSMSAMINGKAWQTDSVYGYRVRYFNDTSKYNLLVTAIRKVNDTISTITFAINNYHHIGMGDVVLIYLAGLPIERKVLLLGCCVGNLGIT